MLLLAAQVASVAVIATQQIRRMRGGAQSHLMLASDGHLYVVKFRNNPQHVRVLANELLDNLAFDLLEKVLPAASDWMRMNGHATLHTRPTQ